MRSIAARNTLFTSAVIGAAAIATLLAACGDDTVGQGGGGSDSSTHAVTHAASTSGNGSSSSGGPATSSSGGPASSSSGEVASSSSGEGGGGGAPGTTASSTTTSVTGSTAAVTASAVASSSSTGTGGSCLNAEDCGDTSVNICDPNTLTCGAAECDTVLSCAATDACLGQIDMPTIGACYTGCTAFSGAGCLPSQYCEPFTSGTTQGFCFQVGTGAINAACNAPNDVSTGCVTGSVCADDGLATNVCRKSCDFFTSPTGCGVGQHCGVGNFCSSEVPDSGALDADCSAAATAGTSCGANASALRGTCQDGGGVNLTCFKYCRLAVAADCTGGETCNDVFGMPGDFQVGLCL